jgi:AcrR family transcriptional regulator
MDRDTRRKLILDAAFKVARRSSFKEATRAAIAEEAGVTAGLVSVYFKGRDTLRAAILQAAVDAGHKKLVKQGLELGVTGVRIPKELRAS